MAGLEPERAHLRDGLGDDQCVPVVEPARPWREQPYADRPYPGEYGDRGRGARSRGLNRPWDRAE